MNKEIKTIRQIIKENYIDYHYKLKHPDCNKKYIPIDGFAYWFHKNLIYCEDTHSFVHRLFNDIITGEVENYKDAQQIAFKVMEEMRVEFEKKGGEK